MYCHEWQGPHAKILGYSCKNKAQEPDGTTMNVMTTALQPILDYVCESRGISSIPREGTTEEEMLLALDKTRQDILRDGRHWDRERTERLHAGLQLGPDSDTDEANPGGESTDESDEEHDDLPDLLSSGEELSSSEDEDATGDDRGEDDDSDDSDDEGHDAASQVSLAARGLDGDLPPEYTHDDWLRDQNADDREEAERGTDAYTCYDHAAYAMQLHVQEWVRRDNILHDDASSTEETADDPMLSTRSSAFSIEELHECRAYLDGMVIGELDHGGSQLFIT